MKKRLVGLTMAAILLVSSIAGCGQGETKESQTAGNETKAETSAETQANASTEGNSGGEELGEPVELVFALTVANTHPYAIAAQNFASIVEEKSGGNMKVKLYYDGALGGDEELLNGMQMGNVTFAMVGAGSVAAIEPIFEFFDLPCLFKTREEAYAFQDTEAVKEMMDGLAQYGYRGLGFYENGFYCISNKTQPIHKLEDMKNMKFRCMDGSDVAILGWELLDVQPVPMAFGELFMAMQQGVVEGQETTIGSFYSSRFYEVQKYLTMSNRLFHVMTFLMSENTWQGLTDGQKAIIQEATEASMEAHKEYMVTFNEDAVKDMVDNYGLEVVDTLDEGEWEKMKEQLAPVYAATEERNPEVYAKLMAAAEEAIASVK
ncbi:TRAP transporter substrate-binding protein [Hominifimenecus sp. rT4P-3]|uniref:TRAP transporter substrate-binding protein n=1 Tax=Hominifimenecus sp. rT4P-3 TaxID=3242979 RepID=UPI003DA56647